MSKPDDKKHFDKPNNIVRDLLSKIRYLRIYYPFIFYPSSLALVFVGWILSNAAWQNCQGRWVVIVGSVIFVVVISVMFICDYANAKRIRFQYFGKPYLMLLLVIIANAALRLHQDSFESQLSGKYSTAISDTNLFYGQKLIGLSNELVATQSELDLARINASVSHRFTLLADWGKKEFYHNH